MEKTDQTGFSIIEVILILVVIGILGFTGWYVYHAKQVSDKSSSANHSSASTNPYAGWKTASLKYEKMAFKYPASWKLTNSSKDEQTTLGTVTPGADTATLTSPTGLEVRIETGITGTGDGNTLDSTLAGAQPIKTLGGTYYLDFYTYGMDGRAAYARGACLDKDATADPTAPYIDSKNIQLANVSGPASAASDVVCIQYKDDSVEKPVTTFEHDASYQDAKLIVKSLTY